MTETPQARLARTFPTTNEGFGAGMGRIWDGRELREGWQRVPGCVRVVNAAIPAPTMRLPPAWAGWRGVLAADGDVYDYETGPVVTAMVAPGRSKRPMRGRGFDGKDPLR